ncbi:signal peptidase II [Helicobacter acinonychis]|uniref:Lipoprotein signal peptidase n=1 Tax=Helicobacter acinonychis (strain Sheeba) TaxID=382638 RepID=LSPA_HELAH|nr:signal peptidase II [Helicobacter acinonychis]Q17VS8.1 RecName: Full=Lipoprotein signal peptidase; AltName: Full=Prolipoprotein signal peptidase; AltName: Full=Signal peptidase II; Short=SPase II [Helicobacter acinonychis str. Sheeba]CAK00248.1 lspA [Helicobacter acinonychis str. Sheeba]STP03195.1 lipoprotein signal peptidase [Helicobacter acinonychis]STP09963.1 lipoprotein signal peptidase [Helicobacter acinonychis]
MLKTTQTSLFIFIGVFLLIFGTDQAIKYAILEGFRYESSIIDIVLVFNKGVAFSLLSFLEGSLKYLQILLILGLFIFLMRQIELFKAHTIEFGMVFGAGVSNILDRFVHGGVVDYVYYHYGFDFAIFNFADVMIDVGVGVLLIRQFFFKQKQNKIKA